MDISSSSDLVSEVGEVLEMSVEPEKREPVSCVIEHTLLPEHLADYADQHGKLQSAQKADEKDIQTLRSEHHSVARLLAEGIPEGVVAEMTGFTKSHISVLKNQPSMIELIAFYRGPKNEAAKVIGEKLKVIGDMSIELLRDKLKKEGIELSVSDLTSAAKLGFDRSGHGPTSTVHNIQDHRLYADEELQQLMRDARRRDAPKIVDPSEVRKVLPQLPPPQEPSNGTSEKNRDTAGSESTRVSDNGNDSSSDNAVS